MRPTSNQWLKLTEGAVDDFARAKQTVAIERLATRGMTTAVR